MNSAEPQLRPGGEFCAGKEAAWDHKKSSAGLKRGLRKRRQKDLLVALGSAEPILQAKDRSNESVALPDRMTRNPAFRLPRPPASEIRASPGSPLFPKDGLQNGNVEHYAVFDCQRLPSLADWPCASSRTLQNLAYFRDVKRKKPSLPPGIVFTLKSKLSRAKRACCTFGRRNQRSERSR